MAIPVRSSADRVRPRSPGCGTGHRRRVKHPTTGSGVDPRRRVKRLFAGSNSTHVTTGSGNFSGPRCRVKRPIAATSLSLGAGSAWAPLDVMDAMGRAASPTPPPETVDPDVGRSGRCSIGASASPAPRVANSNSNKQLPQK